MSCHELSLVAAVHRLAVADRHACARVARLLGISELDARVVVGLAVGGRVTSRSLQAEFDLSPGGATALADRLMREHLVRCEPGFDGPRAVRYGLSDGAQNEVEAALHRLPGVIERIVAHLPAAERRALLACLASAFAERS